MWPVTAVDADLVIVGGGQSGLATAATALAAGLHPVLLEQSTETVGSWPRYYDSLRAFSPAGSCGLPGRRFPGDPHRYPTRDEIADYLRNYRDSLDVDIRTGHHVHSVCTGADGFLVRTTGGELHTRTLIAATGMFGNPHRPTLPGAGFAGRVLHAAEYRTPAAFHGQRVIVVGGGNTAVQIAVDLTGTAEVTLATRGPIRWQRQRRWGRDIHWWLDRTGLDTAPIGSLLRGRTSPVLDDGQHQSRIGDGRPRHRSMFRRLDGTTASWADGSTDRVDTIILATGYRPDLPYLQGLGALDGAGRPHHRHGVSTTVPGLGFVGLEYQRSISSATLRGVGRDAQTVLRRLTPRSVTPTARTSAGYRAQPSGSVQRGRVL
jgi:putative flavoprotein involved in K+ transport